WTTMAEAWEKDAAQDNPFQTHRKAEHLAHVRHVLAKEAAEKQAAGEEDATTVRDGMHITEFVAMGLQLEEQQVVLRFDIAGAGLHPTTDQSRTMLERTSKLRRKIVAWIDIQRGFFPIVDSLRALEHAARARTSKAQPIPGVQVYDLKLWMPSMIVKQAGASRMEVSAVMKDAQDHEFRMRVGQANEALHEIRRQLLVRTHLYKAKDAFARGVRENMRSSGKIDVCNERVRRMAAQYRIARAALVVLGRAVKKYEWQATLKPLLDADCRGMPRATFADPERQKGASKRRRRLSWIWIAQAQVAKPGEPTAMNEALRIEWAKARARAHRWREEIDLLEEEMRRILQFLTWRSDWWAERAGGRGSEPGPQLEGEMAYAQRQAKLQADLRDKFATMWKELPELIRKGREGGTHAGDAGAFAAAIVAASGEQGEDAEDSEDSDGAGEQSDEDEAAYAVPSMNDSPLFIID
ncbi:hypothetical protein C8R43DRAFT_903440, partial [Mycena crocata]